MNSVSYKNVTNSLASVSTSAIQQQSGNNDIIEEPTSSNIIVAVLWKQSKLIASYYDMSQKVLYVISETVDQKPQFPATQSLLRAINPQRVITFGKQSDAYISAIIAMLTHQECNLSQSGATTKMPSNLTLLDSKDYSFNACVYRLKNLRLVSEPENISDRFLYLQMLVNLDSNDTSHIVGALVKFLEQSWRSVRSTEEDLVFLHMVQITLAEHVYIDKTTFQTLNVFNQIQHDSSFKYGGQTSTREGISLFKLLSEHCITIMGFQKLRELLMMPIKNLCELNRRYDFIDLITDPRNASLSSALSEHMRKIVNVMKVISKIQHSQGNSGQWKRLYQTILSILQINEVVKPYLKDSQLLADFSASVTDNLYQLEACIESTVNFEGTAWGDRPQIREGVDKALDDAKAKYASIRSRLVAAARTAVRHLPPHLEDCLIFFVPDMGHIISVRKWAPNCQPDELLHYGCYFLFELNDNYHYKNALCQELDNQLSDLPLEINYHENRIVQRIAQFIGKQSTHIAIPLQHVALMDALMSMGKVSCERQYVRPKFNNDNKIEIRNGRHPLLELGNSNYVANDYQSGEVHPRVKVITGPNASGKSVYLRHVALIVYMAHVGSYLPASYANISLVHSIHSRMHATESAALNMSAFYIDLTQMSNALYNAKSTSLVIMDEFGRGTASTSSHAILLSALQKFLKCGDQCPHILVSTHINLDKEYLQSPQVLHQKMNYVRVEDSNELTFLYKIVNGESSSFTFEMAASVLDPAIIQQAIEINRSFDSPLVYDEKFFNDIALPQL